MQDSRMSVCIGLPVVPTAAPDPAICNKLQCINASAENDQECELDCRPTILPFDSKSQRQSQKLVLTLQHGPVAPAHAPSLWDHFTAYHLQSSNHVSDILGVKQGSGSKVEYYSANSHKTGACSLRICSCSESLIDETPKLRSLPPSKSKQSLILDAPRLILTSF